MDAFCEPRRGERRPRGPRDVDGAIFAGLARSHCRRRIKSGKAKSITDLAEHEGLTDAHGCRLLPLTCLAPDIVEAILDGGSRRG